MGILRNYDGNTLFGMEHLINSKKYKELPICSINEWDNIETMNRAFEQHLKKKIAISSLNWMQFFITWKKQKSNIIELITHLKSLYPSSHEFTDRELCAWRKMMKSVGCINIIPYKKQKSKPEFWTYNVNFNNDNYILSYLFDMNLLDRIDNKETDLKIENQQLKKTIDKFWKSFDESIKINKCGMDGKQRILSIIAEKFGYKEIQDKLQISNTLISDAKKYGRTNGPGCPVKKKPIITRTKISEIKDKEFETFFSDKNNVNNKETLWHKFEATYPDGIKRTYFMARLTNGRYKYRQDLGSLCNICNEYSYETFDILISLLHLNIEWELQCTLINELEILRHHLKRGFENELTINIDGTISHVDTINHCISYAFGECNQEHHTRCNKCDQLFILFEKIIDILPENLHSIIKELQNKLFYFLAHQVRKVYLNNQFKAKLLELDNNGAVLVCDYKMRILPKSTRETKEQFFGKHPKPKWIRIFSDNGGHYHNSELITIIANWNEWYGIEICGWHFFEPGEAKSSVDSHHAQIAHAIKRYIRVGYNLGDGKKIETAIKNISGTSVAYLEPKRDHISVKTLPGITKLFYFEWPINGSHAGNILARELPNVGEWKRYTPSDILKLTEEPLHKPTPEVSEYTRSNSEWNYPLVRIQGIEEIKNIKTYAIDTNEKFPLEIGWALKSNYKYGQRGKGKRITKKVRTYLEGFFLAGNMNKTDRMSAKDMLNELKKIAEEGEIQSEEIPEIKTIEGWITRYSASLRKESAEQRISNNNESHANSNVLRELDENQEIVNVSNTQNSNKTTYRRKKENKYTNEKFPLEIGWALKSNYKYGQRGKGKRITKKVRTYLEGFFLAGNMNKTDRMSAKDMLNELKKIAEEGEIQSEEIPEIKTIEGWITRYSASLRKESAEQRISNNNESHANSNVLRELDENQEIVNVSNTQNSNKTTYRRKKENKCNDKNKRQKN
ncbi:hypothetical protein Glove_159g30 [Diversispora epigaea]|uniref:Uncharacterized protein n=1 Tax=Diversispora epigaea TaxID=1348612 RepID=A0A397IU99_9GLOM|nr:hypothetical protein Glove_159g30 [Diversispora epigaea]